MLSEADEFTLKADLLAYQGRFEEAAVLYNRALQVAPTNADLWAFLGITLEGGLHRTDDALKCWERAMHLDESIATAFHDEEPQATESTKPSIPLTCGFKNSSREKLRRLMEDQKGKE